MSSDHQKPAELPPDEQIAEVKKRDMPGNPTGPDQSAKPKPAKQGESS